MPLARLRDTAARFANACTAELPADLSRESHICLRVAAANAAAAQVAAGSQAKLRIFQGHAILWIRLDQPISPKPGFAFAHLELLIDDSVPAGQALPHALVFYLAGCERHGQPLAGAPGCKLVCQPLSATDIWNLPEDET